MLSGISNGAVIKVHVTCTDHTKSITKCPFTFNVKLLNKLSGIFIATHKELIFEGMNQ